MPMKSLDWGLIILQANTIIPLAWTKCTNQSVYNTPNLPFFVQFVVRVRFLKLAYVVLENSSCTMSLSVGSKVFFGEASFTKL